MEFDQAFNLVEGLVWLVISAVLLARRRRFPQNGDLMIVASAAFAAFGLSDFIEIYTRVWFEPWSLLMLKSACVVTLLICLALYRRRQKRSAAS